MAIVSIAVAISRLRMQRCLLQACGLADGIKVRVMPGMMPRKFQSSAVVERSGISQRRRSNWFHPGVINAFSRGGGTSLAAALGMHFAK